jgi:hypothetical protein
MTKRVRQKAATPFCVADAGAAADMKSKTQGFDTKAPSIDIRL